MRPRRLILHGGDIATAEVLAGIEAIGPPVRAVHGTVDSAELRERLPEALTVDAGANATVYACGPPAMLEAVRALCADRGAAAQLAMESGMACGFGACFGCVVPTRSGYVRLCVDGPVVDASSLELVA